MTGPDFIVIGAMKCGTSTLAAQLAAQPGVFMTTPKEPNFFSDDAIFARGPAWYDGLFTIAAPGDLKGEASTHYTKLPTYPETVARMKAALPQLKLIYMIRNPLERAVSHFIHDWSQGEVGDTLALADLPQMRDYGEYGRQILPFVDAYGAGSIHLTSLEQLKTDPQRTFRAAADFLGLPEEAAWNEEMEAQNVSAKRVRTFPFKGLLIDNPVAKALRQTLAPQSLREWVKGKLTMTERPDLPEAVRAQLIAAFRADRDQLEQHFPGHPALDLCYRFGDGAR